MKRISFPIIYVIVIAIIAVVSTAAVLMLPQLVELLNNGDNYRPL